MLKFECPYSFSYVPSIMNEVLDDFAVDVLTDATPSILKKPAPINVEVFLEYYLKLSIEFKSLSYDKQVLGLTAFNDGYIQVIEESTKKPEPLFVSTGTVIIDTSLLAKRNEPRLRFTLMHEGAHWMIHRKAYSKENFLFFNESYGNQYIAAKEGRIDYSRSQKERNDNEILERQADFFASCLLMPKPTLRMAFADFFRYYHTKPVRIIRGSCSEHDQFAVLLPEYIAKIFNVSKRAALIRLEKLNAISDKSYWGR